MRIPETEQTGNWIKDLNIKKWKNRISLKRLKKVTESDIFFQANKYEETCIKMSKYEYRFVQKGDIYDIVKIDMDNIDMGCIVCCNIEGQSIKIDQK